MNREQHYLITYEIKVSSDTDLIKQILIKLMLDDSDLKDIQEIITKKASEAIQFNEDDKPYEIKNKIKLIDDGTVNRFLNNKGQFYGDWK